jgi:hypothetical protein
VNVRSGKSLKVAALIVAGGLVGLGAASAKISTLRRREEAVDGDRSFE